MTEDRTTGRVTANIRVHEGAAHIVEHGLTHSAECTERYSILPGDPTSAEGEVTWIHEMRRDKWVVRTVTHTHLSCDSTHFHLRARIQAFDRDTAVRDKTYMANIPRQAV